MEPDERAALGVFLAFQYPVEIAGRGGVDHFLRTALERESAKSAASGRAFDACQFLKVVAKAKSMALLNMDAEMLKRPVNVGFSGGEKKRNESAADGDAGAENVRCMDETDSGLDIDALKMVADTVNSLRGPAFSALVITHYQRLLNHIVPDRVHVLSAGRIIKSGGPELAQELEASGYAGVQAAA